MYIICSEVESSVDKNGLSIPKDRAATIWAMGKNLRRGPLVPLGAIFRDGCAKA